MKKALLIGLSMLFITGCSISYIDEHHKDGKRFSNEYKEINIDKNNPIIYKTDEEVIEFLKTGTGIIYFGFPECPWCQSAVPSLLEAANDLGIKEIYYFNPKEIRENNTNSYKEIITLLNDYLNEDEQGNKGIYVPDVYFVSKGEIVGHHFKTVDTQEDPRENPLTEEQKKELKNIYKEMISKTYNIDCDC